MPGARNGEQCDTGFLCLSSQSSVGKPNKTHILGPLSPHLCPLLFHTATTFPLMKFKSAHAILMFNCPQLGPLGLDGILVFLNHSQEIHFISQTSMYIHRHIYNKQISQEFTLSLSAMQSDCFYSGLFHFFMKAGHSRMNFTT